MAIPDRISEENANQEVLSVYFMNVNRVRLCLYVVTMESLFVLLTLDKLALAGFAAGRNLICCHYALYGKYV